MDSFSDQDSVALELYASLVRNAKQVRATIQPHHAKRLRRHDNKLPSPLPGHIFDSSIRVEPPHCRRHAQTRPRPIRTTQVRAYSDTRVFWHDISWWMDGCTCGYVWIYKTPVLPCARRCVGHGRVCRRFTARANAKRGPRDFYACACRHRSER